MTTQNLTFNPNIHNVADSPVGLSRPHDDRGEAIRISSITQPVRHSHDERSQPPSPLPLPPSLSPPLYPADNAPMKQFQTSEGLGTRRWPCFLCIMYRLYVPAANCELSLWNCEKGGNKLSGKSVPSSQPPLQINQ